MYQKSLLNELGKDGCITSQQSCSQSRKDYEITPIKKLHEQLVQLLY